MERNRRELGPHTHTHVYVCAEYTYTCIHVFIWTDRLGLAFMYGRVMKTHVDACQRLEQVKRLSVRPAGSATFVVGHGQNACTFEEPPSPLAPCSFIVHTWP